MKKFLLLSLVSFFCFAGTPGTDNILTPKKDGGKVIVAPTSSNGTATEMITADAVGNSVSIKANVSGTPTEVANFSSSGVSVSGLSAKNYLINGNFDIWQRGASFSGSAVYTADRWFTLHDTTTMAYAKDSGETDVYGAQALKVTQTTKGAGTYWCVIQPIETANVYQFIGKQVTFSFLSKRNSAFNSGNFNTFLRYRTAPDSSPLLLLTAYDGQDAKSHLYSEMSTSEYTKFTHSWTIPTTARSIGVGVCASSTSPPDGSVMWIKQAMLNEGTVAAPFQLAGGDISGEQLKAMRYFQTSYDGVTVPTITNNGQVEFPTHSSYFVRNTISYRVPLRVSSTPTIYSPSDNTTGKCRESTTNVNVTAGINSQTALSFTIYTTGNTANMVVNCHWAVSAEL